MASSALSVFSGIAAAAAGLAGDKVSKSGVIPGLDLATIIPALLGSKAGSAGGIVGKIASVASKSGLLTSANIGKVTELAGSLLSLTKKTGTTETAASGADGIAGLAAAIVGNSGKAANLASIATMASKLAKTAKDTTALTGMASTLGKTLSDSFGVSLTGSGTAVKALDKVLEGDTKSELFKSIIKSLV